jgi:hypothetical protein
MRRSSCAELIAHGQWPPCKPSARSAFASTASRTPRIVTTRTPLFIEAGRAQDGADLGEKRSDLFLPRDLDGANHVERAREIRSLAQRVYP